MANPAAVFVSAIVVIAVWFAVFLVTRAFWCWYFKINRAITLLESIDESLKQLPAVAKSRNVG